MPISSLAVSSLFYFIIITINIIIIIIIIIIQDVMYFDTNNVDPDQMLHSNEYTQHVFADKYKPVLFIKSTSSGAIKQPAFSYFITPYKGTSPSRHPMLE